MRSLLTHICYFFFAFASIPKDICRFFRKRCILFTPYKVTEDMALFAVKIERCGHCGKYMVTSPETRKTRFPFDSTFHTDSVNGFANQLYRSGFVLRSPIKVNGVPICKDCDMLRFVIRSQAKVFGVLHNG